MRGLKWGNLELRGRVKGDREKAMGESISDHVLLARNMEDTQVQFICKNNVD